MKNFVFIFLLIALTGIFVSGQSDLPTKATLENIKGMTKVYTDIVDPTNAFKKVFEKAGLTSVSKASDAQFFLEYRQIGDTRYISSLNIPLQEGRMTAYYYNDGKKTVVWEDVASDSGKHPSPDDKLLKRFIKDRSRTEKIKN